MKPAPPIIMTLQLDEESAAFFERLRRAHFPPALNKIPAHLTLFHALPGDELLAVMETTARAAARPPFMVSVEGLMPLGRGVAFRLASPALVGLRADLARRFAPWLTRQDREGFRPHITVQNKVAPHEARATQAELERTFAPFQARAEGVQLWSYEGGPWAPIGALGFGAQEPRAGRS